MSLATLKTKINQLIEKVRVYKVQNAELTANNEALQSENETLETRVDELEASIKPEQEKSVTIAENGTTEVLPDEGKTLSKVAVNVDVPDTGEQLENIIDQSGVLESTDGTATDKVEQLVDKAEDEEWFIAWIETLNSVSSLFKGYPKAKLPKVNLSKVSSCTSFAENSAIEEVDYYLNFGEDVTSSQNASNLFKNTPNLKKMVGLRSEKFYNASNLFYNSAIEEIERPFNFSSIKDPRYISVFNNTPNLKEIRFVDETIGLSITFNSAVLSDESIQSIIDGLATVTTAQKLTLHASVVARLTEKQYNTIFEKNWNIG